MGPYEYAEGEEPVEPQLAVSVLMLRRDGPEREIFVQHRVSTIDFAAGAVVFPGGRVDAADYESQASQAPAPAVLERHSNDWRWTAISSEGDPAPLDMSSVLLTAAVREVREETGALLVADELLPWANWVTPPGGPKRFDTYFYLAVVGPSVVPRHQTTEAHSSHWAAVSGVLADAARGRLQLMRPTFVLLNELAAFDGMQSIVGSKRRILPNDATAAPGI